MNDDTLTFGNKIITEETLKEIVDKINEKYESLLNLSKSEMARNSTLPYDQQNYSFKSSSSMLTFIVEYSDNNSVTVNNYLHFMSILQSRIKDIKRINISLYLSYTKRNIGEREIYVNHSIRIEFGENRSQMGYKVDYQDNIIDDLVSFIKNKVNESPVRYDDTIKKKRKIAETVNFAKGFIVAFPLSLILVIFVPMLIKVLSESYVLYPIGLLVFSMGFGGIIFSSKMTDLYSNLIPRMEYVKYDPNKGSIYKEDVDAYISQCEVLIGKNMHNLEKRTKIQEEYNKYKRFILPELGILLLASLIIIFL